MSDQIGAEIRDAWAKIAADPETTPETTPERNEAEIRDAWAKIATDEWSEFQSAAAEFGVYSMKRTAMIDTLTDMGVMPGDDPSEDTSEDTTEQSDPESFADLSEDKQDELRAAVETDPSDTDFKQAQDLLATGADYISLAGECLNHEAHEGKAVGANLTEDGLIPFCNHCNQKAKTVTVERLSNTEQTVFSALRKDGMPSSKALDMAEN